MNNIKKYIPCPEFLILFLIFWIGSLFILLFTERGEVELWVNSFSTSILDKPALFITFLGHGLFAFLILVVFLFRNYYYSLYIFFSLILVALFSNIFKRILFFQHFRPMWNFYYDDYSRVIFDSPVNYLRSFPSGHAMTIFALAVVLSTLSGKRIYTIILFLLAVVVCISRIYLLQHYFVDIFWGAFLGVTAAYIGIYISDRFFYQNKQKLMNSSLTSDIKYWLLRRG